MDDALFDLTSWKRSFTTAFRAFIHTSFLFLIILLLITIPSWILGLLGVDLSQVFSWLSVVAFVLAFFLAIFKVLDELRPGDIQFDMA